MEQDIPCTASLPLGAGPEVSANLTVKNTFLSYDADASEDAGDDMRRVASEPTAKALLPDDDTPAKVETIPRKRLPSIPESGFRESAAHLRLVESIETEVDVEYVPSPSQPSALWPPTPESSFLSMRGRLGEPCKIEGTKMELEVEKLWMSYRQGCMGSFASSKPIAPATVPLPQASPYHPVLLGSAPGRPLGSEAPIPPLPSSVSPLATPMRLDDPMPKATAISQLQETLQSVHLTVHFRYPAGVQVLQWSYKQRRESSRAMFRAIVAFLRDGVPHHISGDWDSSKKLARQNAAEASVLLLRGGWAQAAEAPVDALVDLGSLLPMPGSQAEVLPATADHKQLLMGFCRQHTHMRIEPNAGPSEPVWSCETSPSIGSGAVCGASSWVALVRIPLLGVPHTLLGPTSVSPQAAYAELARRVLWYLGCPSCHGLYMPDQASLRANECKIRGPPDSWTQALGGESEPKE